NLLGVFISPCSICERGKVIPDLRITNGGWITVQIQPLDISLFRLHLGPANSICQKPVGKNIRRVLNGFIDIATRVGGSCSFESQELVGESVASWRKPPADSLRAGQAELISGHEFHWNVQTLKLKIGFSVDLLEFLFKTTSGDEGHKK